MKNTLVVIGHPFWQGSSANKRIIDCLAKIDGTNIQYSNIGVLYPDGNIDIDSEQNKLIEADVIVFQFPIQWYGAPSIMHKYMEGVLSYGFAYGDGGDRLKGKHFIASFTAGGPEEAYTGKYGYTTDQLMIPLKAMASYCGMTYDSYVVSYGMFHAPDATCLDHARRLADRIAAL